MHLREIQRPIDRRSFHRLLHNADFPRGQIVEFVHQLVDLAVGGGDLALDLGFLLGGGRRIDAEWGLAPQRLEIIIQYPNPRDRNNAEYLFCHE